MGMIKEGMVIEGPFWPEPVEIKKFDVFGDRVHIIGATIYSNTHIDQLILRAEIEKLKAKEFILDFSAPGSETFLSIEAERYRFASLFEIKGFSREGEADITPNEWFKAKRFKEQFWLYVVANAATSPTLYIINNPAENLNVEEKIGVVRFMVPIDEWKEKGVKA